MNGFASGVGVGVGEGVTVGVGVGVAVGVGATVGVGEVAGVGVAEGTGTETFTPLFQINFLPDLTHVNFFPLAVVVVPTFLQGAPALGVLAALVGNIAREIKTKAARAIFLIPKDYLST
jgi:hypothetical protein